MPSLEPIYILAGGFRRYIGSRDTTKKIFYKQAIREKHLFRVLNAYGIDSDTLSRLLLPKNYKIVLEEVDTKKWYSTDAKTFKEKGQYYHFKEERKDHLTQLFLPLSEWNEMTDQEVFKLQQGY